MEAFNLPTLDGLHLIPGLCDEIALGVERMEGFPSLYTIPPTALLGHHGVTVHGTESRNKSMIIHIKNTYEDRKTRDIARGIVSERTFMNWPFLHQGLVVAVSDSMFKHENRKLNGLREDIRNKCGVIIGDLEMLLHVRSLKGLKLLESGALVKDYAGPEKDVFTRGCF
ncbi:hypothetical protein BYT27DRAFT_7213273 [Phlegmacium glaucopus]|nr:hypothetical protein BYT27DRAFT_7213273 [Phlegmacium glaucopus]